MAATVAVPPRNTTKAGAGAAVPKGGSVPGAGAAYGLSAKQLAAMVSAEVAAQLGPQRSAITAGQKETDAQYAQRLAAIKNLSGSYADLLKGIGPEVHGAYDAAGNAVADYAKGFSSSVQGQADQAAQAEKGLLGVAGAPTDQVSSVLGKLALPTDSLYGLGGAIPASALAREGAAFTSAADMLPAQALGRGQQSSMAVRAQEGQDDAKYRQQLAQLLATVPTLRTNAENNILRNARSDQAESLLEQKYGLQQRTELGNLTGVDPATGQPTYKAASAKTKAEQALATRHDAALGRRNKATASILTKLGNWVYQQRHQRGAVVIGHEPRTKTITDAAGLKETQYLTPSGWVTASSPPKNTVMKPIYNQHGNIPAPEYVKMQRYLTQQVTSALRGYGYKPAEIKAMVTDLLGGPDPAVAQFDAELARENAARTVGPH